MRGSIAPGLMDERGAGPLLIHRGSHTLRRVPPLRSSHPLRCQDRNHGAPRKDRAWIVGDGHTLGSLLRRGADVPQGDDMGLMAAAERGLPLVVVILRTWPCPPPGWLCADHTRRRVPKQA